MPNIFVQNILDKIKTDFGSLKKIGDGNSLYEISCNGALIYFRYSKLTSKGKRQSGFYGLRKEDVKILEGKNSYISFVWDREDAPVLIPFKNYKPLLIFVNDQ